MVRQYLIPRQSHGGKYIYLLHIISRNCYNLIPKEGDVVLTTLAFDVQ